ncbi:MAG: D-alanyl-D-alanine carboxypeptidase [Oscillospiraceae bacterium]|nr:D-alanyl-D-alanine carboxypeptidase [Oscillospiraceae bacterium]
MCKKGLIALCLAVCLGGSCLAAPEVAAPSCLLMERSTGTVLYEKEADRQLAPASVTKVMTLLLVMEAIDRGQLRWDDLVTASAHAAEKGGSQVFLEENEQMTVRDMVKCVTVSSANDCAAALAEAVAGSESAFVELMNRRAEELGMTGTHFANCTGLDDEAGADVHYTTARDIAVMSRELLSHPEIRQFTTIWMDTIRDGTFGLSNTNKLVRFYPDTTGLKTGYTSSAGYCMSASAEREGMELIAAVMHCGSSTDRFESAKSLLEYGFSNFTLVDPAGEEEIPRTEVELGKALWVQAVPMSAEPLLLERSAAASIRREIQVQPSVAAPVEPGQTLGTLRIYSGESLLAEVPLQAQDSVERLGWTEVAKRFLKILWMGRDS